MSQDTNLGSNLPKYQERVLIDFDGVIHSYLQGWLGIDVIPDPPVDGAIDWLELMMDNFAVSIFSVRCNESSGIEAMRTWLFKHGMLYSKLMALHFQPGKPACRIIIDDRALRFDGVYPTPDQIEAMDPWYYGLEIYQKYRR